MLYIWTGAPQIKLGPVLKPLIDAGAHGKYRVVPLHEIPKVTGDDVVLSMGVKALTRLAQSGLVPKGQKIDSLRCRRFQGPETHCDFLVSFDPQLVEIHELGPKIDTQIRWDARLAWRLHETGTLRPTMGKYQWADSLDLLVKQIEKKLSDGPVRLSHDLETMGLYPYYEGKEIVTSAWSIAPGTAWVLDHRKDPKLTHEELRYAIKWLFNSEQIRTWGANWKFDAEWMALRWGITCSNFTLDTTIAGCLLNENRHNSLNQHTKEYAPELGGYDDEFNHTAEKEHMELELEKDPASFLDYAGGDVDAVQRIAMPIARQLHADPMLERFYKKLLHPASRCFEKIEMRGMLVDAPKLEELGKEVASDIRDNTGVAMHMIPMPVKSKHVIDGLKLSRSALVVDALFTPDGFGLKPTVMALKQKPHRFDMGWENEDGEPRMPSVSVKDHLATWRHHPEVGEFVQALERISSAKKTLSTYIGGPKYGGKGFLAHLRPDGRFHPTYILYAGGLHDTDDEDDSSGTNTGRLAAKEPAMQTLPKHTKWAKKLRECYPAPPGMLCWQLDFSQGELRFAACLANEQTMIQAYLNGIDMHAQTGSRLNGVGLEEMMSWKPKDHPRNADYKAFRQGGKAGNFGLLYSMGAKGFVEYAWKTYGVVVSIEQAQEWKDDFFGLYPGLVDWHLLYKALAHQYGYIRSPLGRIRHLPLIFSSNNEIRAQQERRAINSPVQGGLSDLNLLSIVHLERHFEKHEKEFHVVGSTHDSANGYVIAAHAEQMLADAVGVSSNLPIRETFGWEHQLPFPVDPELGDTMGSLEERPDLAAA